MKKKLLICEDDLEILEVFKIIYGDTYEVATARRITDIIELVQLHQPDLILMDLWIPETGGAEAVKILKAHDRLGKIPVLLVSASDRIWQIGEEVGADGCLEKPFSIDHCRKLVSDMLKGQAAAG